MSEIGREPQKKNPSKKRDHTTLSHLLLIYLFHKKDGAIQQNIISALVTSKEVFDTLISELKSVKLVEVKTRPTRFFKITKAGKDYTKDIIEKVEKKADYAILLRITTEDIEKLRKAR